MKTEWLILWNDGDEDNPSWESPAVVTRVTEETS